MATKARQPCGACSPPMLSSLRRPARRRAQQLIDSHLYDPNFLQALLRHSPTADFLAEVLKGKASHDEAFARLVVESCQPLTPREMQSTLSTPKKRSASSLMKLQSQNPRPGVAPRSLLSAFNESPEIPAKAAKVETFEAESFLDPLPFVLAAQVSSFLRLREKLCFMACNRQARALKQQVSTWEPLVLDAIDCAHVLRQLKSIDPRGQLEPRFYPSPACAAWAEVSEVHIEVMEPDRPPGEDIAKPRFVRSSAMVKMILDPIDELARRLTMGWLAGASHLHLSNIEVNRMDALFLEFRLKAFRMFPRLRLQHDGLDSGRYCLHACREPGPLPTIANAHAMMEERFPRRAELQMLLEWPKEITEAEALFLQEHTLMVKSGHGFRNLQQLWHLITEEEVREQYGLLHAQLTRGLEAPAKAEVIVI